MGLIRIARTRGAASRAADVLRAVAIEVTDGNRGNRGTGEEYVRTIKVN